MYEKTREYSGINVCLPVILNLFENYDEMMQTAQTIAKLEPDGVKIHMLCALKGTKLAEMYDNKEKLKTGTYNVKNPTEF